MIRAIGMTGDGRPLVLLGLDAQNLNRLREGQPIRVNLRHLNPGGPETGLPDIDVVVFFGGADEIQLLAAATKKPS